MSVAQLLSELAARCLHSGLCKCIKRARQPELRDRLLVSRAAIVAAGSSGNDTAPSSHEPTVTARASGVGIDEPVAPAAADQVRGGAQPTVVAGDGDVESDRADDDNDTRCEVCGSRRRARTMLLCDGCDCGFHTTCVGLTEIPAGDWLCAVCSPSSDEVTRAESEPAASLGGDDRAGGPLHNGSNHPTSSVQESRSWIVSHQPDLGSASGQAFWIQRFMRCE